MIALRVEDLKLWQRAVEFSSAIIAILERVRDRELRHQLSDAAESIVSNIAEGFPQPTDKAFANYLYHSKGSTSEARARLRSARNRQYITADEFEEFDALGDQVAAMTTGLIKYLLRSNRRRRGLGRQLGGDGQPPMQD